MNICIFISALSSFTLCILKEIPWICSPTAFVNLSQSFKVLTMNLLFHPAQAEFVGHGNSRNLTLWVIWDSCVLKSRGGTEDGVFTTCVMFSSALHSHRRVELRAVQASPGSPLVCVHSFLPMTSLTARAISPNTPEQYMCDVDLTARLVSSHKKTQTEILEERGRMLNSLWATDAAAAKPLWRHFTHKWVWGHTCDVHAVRALTPHRAHVVSPRAGLPQVIVTLPSCNTNTGYSSPCSKPRPNSCWAGGSTVPELPEQGRVSISCPEQLSRRSAGCTRKALDRDWRPAASKLLPLMQVSSQELHSDHSVRWQSPAHRNKKSQVFKKN